ncbi:hypothetical protein FQA47_014293 [Oryzias melastigma]|uniref:Uncharacterized protein n=1 Tax=Oryzias melastigma TaxID=30732 RepID=A0A834FJJ6_ORYME|nr:hypothetical protein FQA47_014293 [Oryzias melastigma]
MLSLNALTSHDESEFVCPRSVCLDGNRGQKTSQRQRDSDDKPPNHLILGVELSSYIKAKRLLPPNLETPSSNFPLSACECGRPPAAVPLPVPRRWPRLIRGKVCFHEDQLEQVCEYPSETSMLTFNPLLHDGGKAEEAQEEEGEEGLLKSTRSLGIAPRLRVDESCPR